MPINSDGTISAPLQRYVTRVVLEFSYLGKGDEDAQMTHDYILETLTYGANSIDEFMAIDHAQPTVRVSNAKSPQPLPEGQTEEGGSVSGA